jgi:predicted transposase/invertase (TIGR01784 family)
LPSRDRPDAPVYFLEVQMQRDALLYRRLSSEVFLYLYRQPSVKRWRAVVVYPSAAIEVAERETFGTLLSAPDVRVVYLNELASISELSPGLGTLRLMVEPAAMVPKAARGLLARVQQSPISTTEAARLIELIETVVVYTFPRLSREEITAMLGLTDLVKDSRFYQETRAEALQEGVEREKALIVRLLQRKLGELPETVLEQVSQLPLEQLESLGEALLDFEGVADLQTWLTQQIDVEK